MCKNDYKKHNCKHHHHKSQNCQLDNDIECAIVENGAKEHLKEYENKKKGKFDYRKYIRKKDECRKPKYLGYKDLKFDGLYAHIEFPNGFAMMVSRDESGRIEEMQVRDAIDGFMHSRWALSLFPELRRQYDKLHNTADLMILTEAMRKVQDLTREDWKKFRNGE